MTDPTDVIERAQAWLTAADERGINRTDKDGYLAVIEGLVAEVEFQRTALQGYRNRQIELTDLLIDIRAHGRITGDTAIRLIRVLGNSHPCTCHPDDNPPVPRPKKYALGECRKAALGRED